jgi:hypothetical protein
MVSGSLSFSELVVMGRRAFVQERALAKTVWKVGRTNRKGSKVHTARAGLGLRYLGDPSAGSTIEVVAEELAEPPLVTASTTRTTRNQHQEAARPAQRGSGTRVTEQHASIPLRRVRAGELRCEEFLYELKAGPAGGRLRRPSSAGNVGIRPT